MIMDIQCDKCSVYLIDSGDKCHHCGHPKSEFILKMQDHHQRTKKALVAREGAIKEERITEDLDHLSSAVRKLVEARERIGPRVPEELIELAFQKPI